MGHNHDHGTENMGDGKLLVAIGVNLLLTVAQVVGGGISGSLSLIADALHNLSDAAALVIALVARKIGRKPADDLKTFGYKRAEIIAALINLTTLVIIGLYLIYEALWRFAQPQEIEGWTVVIVAGIALVVDIVTAVLTYAMAKNNMNIKAAFLHNVSDAMASIGVIIAGTLILLYGWFWVDALLTLIIAGYVLWQGFTMLPKTIHLLMEGTPEHLSIKDVIVAMTATEGVKNVHHVHVWQLDEHHNALEAHVVLSSDDSAKNEQIKTSLTPSFKQILSPKTPQEVVRHATPKNQYTKKLEQKNKNDKNIGKEEDMKQRLSIMTLGVENPKKSRSFCNRKRTSLVHMINNKIHT